MTSDLTTAAGAVAATTESGPVTAGSGPAGRTQRLPSSFEHRFHAACRRTAVLAGLGLATADGGLIAWAAMACLAAASWVSYRRVLLADRPLPQPVVTLMVLVATIAAAAEWYLLGAETILALGHYMMLVQAARLMERKRGRDHSQVLLLAGLTMVIGAVVSVSVTYAIFLLLFLWTGGQAVLLLQIKRESERRRELMLAGGLDERWVDAQDPLAGAATPGPLRRYAFAAGCTVLALGAMLSLALPRGNAGFLGEFQARPLRQKTGFDETVEFNRRGEIEQDETEVMHVRITDALGRDVPEARLGGEGLLLRGATQDVFDGTQWSTDVTGGGRRSNIAPIGTPAAAAQNDLTLIRNAAGAGRLWRVEVTLQNAAGHNIFLPYPPARMILPPSDRFILDRLDLTLRTERPMTGTVKYAAEWVQPAAHAGVAATTLAISRGTYWRRSPRSEPHHLPGPGYARGWERPTVGGIRPLLTLVRRSSFRRDDAWTEENRKARQDLEDLAARVIADSVGGDAAAAARLSPKAKVAALTDWLRNTFRYRLNPPDSLSTSRRPMPDFLTEVRAGNCQYFASSLVLLCRTTAVDVPARIVTGFRATEYNDTGRFFVVRGKDAHAWTEVHLDGEGWVAFDATPATPDDDQEFWLFREARQLFQALDHGWANSVLSYNRSQRETLGSEVAQWLMERGVRPGWLGSLPSMPRGLRMPDSGEWPALLAGAGLVAVGLWLLFGRRPAAVKPDTATAVADRGRTAPRPMPEYDRLADLFAGLGISKPPSVTPLAFARAVAAGGAPELATLPAVVESLYAAKWSGRPLADRQADEVRRMEATVRGLVEKRRAEFAGEG